MHCWGYELDQQIHDNMLEQNYQKLKKVIQHAVPEIMELKFGCEVVCPSFLGKQMKFRYAGKKHTGGMELWSLITDTVNNEKVIANDELKYEVLGRPIRLADVVFAMGLEKFNTLDTQTLKRKSDILHLWNFQDDNLDHQNDDCKEFLINLLV